MISVFDSAINIKTRNSELLVITKNATRSPITMNVVRIEGTMTFKDIIKFGSSVIVRNGEMIINDAIIHLKNPQLFRNYMEQPRPYSLSKFRDAHKSIFSSIIKLARPGCLIWPDITTKGLLLEELNYIESKKTSDDNSFSTFLSDRFLELCGRGPGYTPAGDDFIGGFMLMFNWCSKFLKFQSLRLGQEYSKLTSWTSYKLMKYNEGFLCDEELERMINSVANGRVNEYLRNMIPISYRGHTSGIDLLTGMTCALYTIIDRKFKTNLLMKFSSVLK